MNRQDAKNARVKPENGLRMIVCAAILAACCVAQLRAQDGYPIDPASPVADAIRRAEAALETITAIPDAQRTFDNTLGAMDDVFAQVSLDTGMVMFLQHVSTDPAERERGEQAERDMSNWYDDVNRRAGLYRAVRALADRKPSLDRVQAKLLDNTLRDFRRSGTAMEGEPRERLEAVERELNDLGIEFEKNIREDETVVPLTREELAGVPGDVLAGFERSGEMILLGMSYPEYVPVMRYCDNAATRQKVFLAYNRRGGRRNVTVLEKVLKLRAEKAALLGYPNAAEYELEPRMAHDTGTVMAFFEKLRPLVRRKALLDFAEYTDAKRRHTGEADAALQPWDGSYYGNLLRIEKYALDERKVQEYFPMESVIGGLFSITQKLYGLKYSDITQAARAQGRPVWHEDVRLFEVTDEATGKVIGEFYIDLYPREGKYGHAAQWGLRQHKVWGDGRVTRPLAALVCNFTKPTADKPSLLTHNEVETFFHEFGHCLHTLLSESRYYQQSGTSVELDFVEAPSQMFENWVWDPAVLQTFAKHYQTGEPFPKELLEGMIAAKNQGSGLSAERQFFYGLYDMRCHLPADGVVDTTQLADELLDPARDPVELYAFVPGTRFHASFGHLMGYQAGYYSYQWSLVYACDMFQRFKELGMLNPEAGRYYREKVLSRGGTMDGHQIVRDYLGREPDMTAYLRYLGLETQTHEATDK